MRLLDLFSGCGGMSLGFMRAGFDVVGAFDSWQAACDVYALNFAHPIHRVDLRDTNNWQQVIDYRADIIIGGPPCQDFSSAGKRDESLGRADLTVTYAQLIAQAQPQIFVMENVERIKNSYVLKQSKAIFRQQGYGLTEVVLLASLCGVPQNRKRYFLIGVRGADDNALKPYLERSLAAKPMTVHDYLGDELGVTYYYRHPRTYQRRGVFSIFEPSPTVRGVNRPVPPNYRPHKGDAGPVDEHLRPLTTIERSYIQTFPRDFQWVGTKSNLEQMIGNAVPVNLAEYVGRAIQAYLADKAADTLLDAPALFQKQLL